MDKTSVRHSMSTKAKFELRFADISTCFAPETCSGNATYQFLNGEGAMMTKYKFGSLKLPLHPDNNDTNFITNFQQITKTRKKWLRFSSANPR